MTTKELCINDTGTAKGFSGGVNDAHDWAAEL